MTVGFQAETDNGTLLIDENYSNLKLVRIGTSQKVPNNTSIANAVLWEAGHIDISCMSGQPVVFFRPRAGFASCSILVNSPLAPTLAVVHTGNANPTIGDYRYIPFEYAVFDSFGGAGDVGNYGLQIFREDGTIAFNALDRYCEIAQVTPFGSWTSLVDNQAYIDHPLVPNAWYMMQTAHGGYMDNPDANVFVYYAPMLRQVSATRMAYSIHQCGWVNRYSRIAQDTNGTSAVFARLSN